LELGLAFLRENPIDDEEGATLVLDDALRAVHLSKSLSQNGYVTGNFLASIAKQMSKAKEELESSPHAREQILADYLDAAIQEINISRYLEEL